MNKRFNRITVDPEKYRAELESQGAVPVDLTETAPTLIATVDDTGLVIALAVDTTPPAGAIGDQRDRYFLTAAYDEHEVVSLPVTGQRDTLRLNDLDYPTAEEPWQFRP